MKKEDVDLYTKLKGGTTWQKQMPKLAVSLGLSNKILGLFASFFL